MRSAVLTAAVCLLAACLLLGGCMPADSFRDPDTTEENIFNIPLDTGGSDNSADIALSSDNYSLTKGQYYYFFSYYLSEFISDKTDEELAEYGIGEGKSLKDVVYADGKTLYDLFEEVTVDYMTELLLFCEAADREGIGLTSDEEYYIDHSLDTAAFLKDMTVEEYVHWAYNGNFSAAEYFDAAKLEYKFEKYVDILRERYIESLTDEEIAAYADRMEGEKDTTLSRNVMYVWIDGGGGEKLRDSFLAGERTTDTLEALAIAAAYAEVGKLTDCTKDTLAEAFASWLFADGRTVGDVGLVTVYESSDDDEGYEYLLFYYSDGRAAYLSEAMELMADDNYQNLAASLKSSYAVTRNDEVLGSLNA